MGTIRLGWARAACAVSAGLLALALAIWFSVRVADAIRAVEEAERSLRAAYLASDALDRYVRARREWPKSWSDLESLAPAGARRPIEREDWSEMRGYLEVDFDLTLADVARQTTADFRAIRAPKVSKATVAKVVAPLLETVRRVSAGERVGDEREPLRW